MIEQQRITDLPLNGRNFFSLVALSPNVTYGFNQAAQAAGRQGGSRSELTMSLAGARSAWSNYTLDGITNTDINFNLYIVLPSVEALQEFKVQTGIYPAEFGRAAGQINVSTKGGTNQYHGALFEFLRNDKLDARPYFFKDPESPTQTAPLKAPTARISTASRWPGRSRFRSYSTARTGSSSWRTTRGSSRARTPTNFFTTMTPAMRAGDFSVVPTPLQDPVDARATPNPTGPDSPSPRRHFPATRFRPTASARVRSICSITSLRSRTCHRPACRIATINTWPKHPSTRTNSPAASTSTRARSSQWFGRYSWTDELTITPGRAVERHRPLHARRASGFLPTRAFSRLPR